MKIKFCPTAYLLSLGLIAQPSFALMPYHVHFNNPPLRMKNHNNHSNWQKDLDAQDNSNLGNVVTGYQLGSSLSLSGEGNIDFSYRRQLDSSTNEIQLRKSQQDRKILKISNLNRTSPQNKKIINISNVNIKKYSDPILSGSHISSKTYKQMDESCGWSDLIDVSKYDHNEDLKHDYDENISKDVEEYPIFPLFQYIKNFFLV